MPTYLSPGVYVEEVASGNAPIAGVGTSTAGFIGVIDTTKLSGTSLELVNNDYYRTVEQVSEEIGFAENITKDTEFKLSHRPVDTTSLTVTIGTTPVATPSTNFSLKNSSDAQQGLDSTLAIKSNPALTPNTGKISITYKAIRLESSVKAGEVKLCTNFGEFKKFFGDFTASGSGQSAPQNTLAHAVYGFFNNGGTRCYVVWVKAESEIKDALETFEAIDEIAIVAAPGVTTQAHVQAIANHCEALGDRVAVLDGPKSLTLSDANVVNTLRPFTSKYAALYIPWIHVFDPIAQTAIAVPPSGHIAGIYARVDTQRGVHKAPANETVFGAVNLSLPISKAQQDGLNPAGINCIRSLNGNIQVWGARTLGGNDNGEFKYISTRRLFNYLRESIDEGTQWTVFEPNSPELWAKIRRSVTAFLTTVWRTGALFGTTPDQAFFVKCDEETNPPDLREQGQVVTVIGIAVVKPAEFVIFRISQWTGEGGS